MKYILLLILLLFSSCHTIKWAEKGIYKRDSKYPQVVENICATRYPTKDSVREIIEYIQGATVIDHDTITVDCDTVRKTKIVKIPVIKSSFRIDTFTKEKITPPRIVREALALYGTTETPGSKSNPTILAWAKETNIKDDDWYTDDSIPWCGLFTAIVAQRAEWEVPAQPLRALSWANFGNPVDKDKAVLGDILVFVRKGGGHVGLYVGEDSNNFYVLGGNQSDKVNITKIAKNRLHAVRRPKYKIAAPESAKKYFYNVNGPVSTNEA